ncbi:putative membrane protein DUF2061 [Stella humosa]|uniref:Putative membrane protein DUF2061 n=1 Tax=Stella humosa TaxID=94 RepID=A0A3N1M8N1_9PROT|nr:DUF2061 domain-containing protein [Stella humosa]ROQ00073.1 putative membrane protein DUF2061 [Stella humosa]BBK30694.1 hypothetical protein STHU_13280 [Stella humosa]
MVDSLRMRLCFAILPAIALLAATLLAPAAARAADPAPLVGAEIEGHWQIAGKQVPLPAGRWVVAAHALAPYAGGQQVGAYGAIHSAILLQVDGDRITAKVEIHANALPVMDGWGIAADCERTDLPIATIRYKAGWDGSCFFLTHTTANRNGTATARSAAAFIAERGLRAPPEWLTVGFRVANRSDVVDARFHFTPALWSLPDHAGRWAASPWAPKQLEGDPVRLGVARSLTEWAVGFSGLVEAGIKNRLDPTAQIAMPNAVADHRGVLEQRRAAIDDLLKSGAIDGEMHQRQIALLVERGLDPGSQVADPATVALYKTLAYRPMVSFANIWIDYFWIGQPWAAGMLVLLQVTVNTTKFYFHELAWEQVRGPGSRRDSARVIDFAYLGTNR